MTIDSRKSFKLDLVFLKRFCWCLKILLPRWLSTPFLLFVLLLGLSLTEEVLAYNTGLLPSQFYGVMTVKDKQGFQSLVILASILVTSTALSKSLVQYVSAVLYINWRKLLSEHLHRGYFNKEAYYKINVLQEAIDNPDQRITQDVMRFSHEFSKLMSKLIVAPFVLVYYTYQCYKSSGYLGPISIYGYFVANFIINRALMSPIVNLVVKQEHLEGDFRFKHMQVKVNSEALAFYRSGPLEEKKTNVKLWTLLATQFRIAKFQFFLNSAVNFTDTIGSSFSYAIVAIGLFAGKYSKVEPSALSAEISKNAFLFMYLINRFTEVILLSNHVADMAGYTHRIGEFLEYLKKNDKTKPVEVQLDSQVSNGRVFNMKNVTFGPPNSGRSLVRGLKHFLSFGLDLQINLGKNLLVTGFTGVGKTSLLRVLSGLWKEISGSVTRYISFHSNRLMFLPQKAYLTDGSLREQIVYPHEALLEFQDDSSSGLRETDKIFNIIKMVGLTGLYDRVGHIDRTLDQNWEDILSPGEIQKLSFARLFYHHPEVAVLDEATSAMEIDTETAMYSACRHLNITVVSVGQPNSLIQFHDEVLQLNGTGEWSLCSVTRN